MPRNVVGYGTAKPQMGPMPQHVQAKDVQPHAVVTKPNGMGRTAGAPRGQREMPQPIIPIPIQGGRRVG